MTDLIKQIEELNLRCDSSTLLPVIERVEQLIKERDEARREICERREYQWHNPRLTAVCRGWDCYKEKTP